jgi:hypothetical protein
MKRSMYLSILISFLIVISKAQSQPQHVGDMLAASFPIDERHSLWKGYNKGQYRQAPWVNFNKIILIFLEWSSWKFLVPTPS